MRRLPIYFLIDISESMIGEPIQMVEEGLAMIIKALKEDPYALETVHISIVVFAGQARTLVPLQEIITFYPPRFPIGGGTSLGNGLGHLMYELRKNTIQTTAEQKGDWKPIVFLFTDGVPTDDTQVAINEWKKNWAPKSSMVAVSFGEEADLQVLQQLTENVFMFKNTSVNQYKSFFKWVTASIKSSSMSVETGGTGFELSKPDEAVISKLDPREMPPKPRFDHNFTVFTGKCQHSQKPYLIKYRRTTQPTMVGGMEMNSLVYRLVGAYLVDSSYFDYCDENAASNKVGTDEIMGAPTCPSCGNQYGLSICQCGKIHCCGNEEVSTCPWCGNKGRYGFGEGRMDINSAQG
jgi:uncharacterized protein YegL